MGKASDKVSGQVTWADLSAFQDQLRASFEGIHDLKDRLDKTNKQLATSVPDHHTVCCIHDIHASMSRQCHALACASCKNNKQDASWLQMELHTEFTRVLTLCVMHLTAPALSVLASGLQCRMTRPASLAD
jgi:hypothetical protein